MQKPKINPIMPLFTQAPESLCILRLSAIGDVCNALAAVQQIQAYWPQTQITWIVGKVEYQLLSAITQNIHFEIYDKKTGFKGIFALWRKLKHQRFDALLNLQTAFRASLLSIGIKANYKIGFGQQRSRECQQYFVNQRVQDPVNPHVLGGFLAFVEYLGVPIQAPSWHLHLEKNLINSVQPWLAQDKPNLLIAPCSSKAEKDWTLEGYVAAAQTAHQQGYQIILAGGASSREQQMAENIKQKCDFPIANTVGKTTLAQLVALIKQVDLVISPDSASAHIANMCGTAVIGLYAYHNPLRTGPYYHLDNVISVYEQNAIQQFGKPSSQLPWATKLSGKNLMAQIQPQNVVDAITAFTQHRND